MSTDIQLPMYSIAFRMPFDSAAAPHMVQITEIAVMCSPPLFGRVPSRVHGFCFVVPSLSEDVSRNRDNDRDGQKKRDALRLSFFTV